MEEEHVRSVVAASRSAVDLAAAEIGRAVLTGALAPGSSFVIRDLAAQLGFSHIPVREALRRLGYQGLVELPPARSARVAPISPADLRAIYRLRQVIEVPLAQAAAGTHTSAELNCLDALLEASRDGDVEKGWQADYHFHEVLVRPAMSEWDARLLRILWMASERYTHLLSHPTRVTDDSRVWQYESHRVLRDAALHGDGAAMAEALRTHLVTEEDRIRTQLDVGDGQ